MLVHVLCSCSSPAAPPAPAPPPPSGSFLGSLTLGLLLPGLWAGNEKAMDQEPIDATYITAMVKGGSNGFALKGADATAGPLKSLYDGARPAHYQPMKKQGSIILGIGGDNSDSAQGTFYEGVMTSGYASNATDAAVQANIVAAGCECSRSHFFALPLSLLLTYLLLRRWEVSAPPINPGFAHSASAFRRQPRQQAPSQSTSPQPQDQQRIKPLGLGAICQLVALSRSGGGTRGRGCKLCHEYEVVLSGA